MSNRPVNFSDPTGHDGIPSWITKTIDLINPFKYDTWYVSARGALKYYVGVEGDLSIYADFSKGLKNTKVSINVEGSISLGLSAKLRGAVVVGSTKDKIDEISGAKLIGKDGYNGTVAGCLNWCFGVVPGVDKKRTPNSKGYLFGYGEGYDISANLISVSDYIFKADAEKKTSDLHFPILNEKFLKSLPVIGPVVQKYIPE